MLPRKCTLLTLYVKSLNITRGCACYTAHKKERKQEGTKLAWRAAFRASNVQLRFPFAVQGNLASSRYGAACRERQGQVSFQCTREPTALNAASLLAQAGHRFAAFNVVQPPKLGTNQPTTNVD